MAFASARWLSFCLVSMMSIFLLSCIQTPARNTHAESPSNFGQPASLPLPGSMPLVDYETQLYNWIQQRRYVDLGWIRDKDVRDTGPWIDGKYYGSHPAVRIYYSPGVMKWLVNGRKGEIPDGAMIIKEMFSPPAALYQELKNNPAYPTNRDYDRLIDSLISEWTVMVKNSSASADGWFWGSVSLGQAIDQQVDTRANRDNSAVQLRYSGFAMPCIRCHASAESELTFSDLANIKGFSGEPLQFMVDNSWRTPSHFDSGPIEQLKNDPFVQSLIELPTSQLPWNTQQQAAKQTADKKLQKIFSNHSSLDNSAAVVKNSTSQANQAFIDTFPQISKVDPSSVKKFPPQWLDHVPMPAGHLQKYVTSDNCLGCHGGLGGSPSGVSMFIQTGPNYGDGFNISEFGEWRWSPMGLAGRDPIFHSQLETEMAILKNDAINHPEQLKAPLKATQQAVTNTCLSCHGAMGQRQLTEDAKKDPSLDANFKVDYYYLSEALTKQDQQLQKQAGSLQYDKYGELAREGISCMVCHHIDAPNAKAIKDWQPKQADWLTFATPKELAYMMFHNNTGQFNAGPADKINGPFDVSEKPMEHALNSKPVKNHYTSDSQMCGTCHTINLPNIGMKNNEFPVLTAAAAETPFSDYNHSIEQATFLEWQNSIFAVSDSSNDSNDEFQSCQDCHMPSDFKLDNSDPGKSISIDQLVTKIATIQDTSVAEAAYTLPQEDLDIPMRDNYKRHTHVGMNVFLLEMFNQFSDILGVGKTDYMTSATTGNQLAIDSMVQQAQKNTLDISANILSLAGDTLTTQVILKNKSGHRLPSGVAFRRMFIDFQVLNDGKVIWQSGKTNKVGVIVGANSKPLETEFLPDQNSYQPHYEKITQENQVQIYEELNLNAQNEFTTSFIHRVTSVKDNRLLPRGWREASYFKPQGAVMYQFMQATDPHGKARQDSDYQNPSNSLSYPGQDQLIYSVKLPKGINKKKLSVRATAYSQSIPPYWLKQRFEQAPDGIATQRLYYLTSNLKLQGTAMENWKLKLVSAEDNLY